MKMMNYSITMKVQTLLNGSLSTMFSMFNVIKQLIYQLCFHLAGRKGEVDKHSRTEMKVVSSKLLEVKPTGRICSNVFKRKKGKKLERKNKGKKLKN